MKSILFVAALIGCLLFCGSAPALAANPVSWQIVDLTTYGGDVIWLSPTFIDPGYAQYDFTYTLTKVEGQIGGLVWLNVTSEIPEEDRSGSGSAPGPLPIELANESFSEPGIIGATVHVYVDASGYGHMDLTDIELGEILGLDITGVRVSGVVGVTGTPEPATMGMLAVGGLALLRRRRRKV